MRTVSSASVIYDETGMRLYLCRDSLNTVLDTRPARSLVAVGARKNWLSTGEKWLARRVRPASQKVVISKAE